MMFAKLTEITAKTLVFLALLVTVIWSAGLCYGAFKVIAAVI